MRFYCLPQSQLGLGFGDWDFGLTIRWKFNTHYTPLKNIKVLHTYYKPQSTTLHTNLKLPINDACLSSN